jgi:hypothetical protein
MHFPLFFCIDFVYTILFANSGFVKLRVGALRSPLFLPERVPGCVTAKRLPRPPRVAAFFGFC